MTDQGFIANSIQFMVATFILMLGIIVLVVLIVYLMDVTQKRTALLRNYPVIGHFRYLFEHLGEFFRQYFFAMDREELPFNRSQRTWIARASKNMVNTVAFGSTKDLRKTGSVMFINSPFPTLEEDAVHCKPITLGENCRHPYTTDALFCISGMSFGALSRPAVQALSHGAKLAGIWRNSGGSISAVITISLAYIAFDKYQERRAASMTAKMLFGTDDPEEIMQKTQQQINQINAMQQKSFEQMNQAMKNAQMQLNNALKHP